MDTPEQFIALLTGQGGFDPGKMRSRLLTRFGGEEGVADWIYDLMENPDTPPTTKAKCADILLNILETGKNLAMDVDTMDDNVLERMAKRVFNAAGPRAGLGKTEPQAEDETA